MRDRLAAEGYEAIGASPVGFTAFYRAEVALWAKVIKDSGIKSEE
jgi:hypothetical protein